MAIATIGMYVSKKEYILVSKNAAIMCGMYVYNKWSARARTKVIRWYHKAHLLWTNMVATQQMIK